MTAQLIGAIILWLIVAIIAIAIVVYLVNWLYRRSSKEVSFVRTGLMGERVVIDGGAFVLPIIHDITPVNMNVLQMSVARAKDDALITKDRMRVDIDADFYVRVAPTRDAVALAAATLGRRTMEQERLHALLSGKFVSALRSVASEMTMVEMHEQRGTYVQRVKAAAAEALAQNGLELETVALTDLDQTDLQFFNPSNRFDAEGLTRLIGEIEDRRKLRNDIEQDSMIKIRARNLEAEKQALDIERESEAARLNQERDVEVSRAIQRAELARERALRDTEAERAQIAAREEIEKSRIANEKAISEARIASEGEVRQREIERQRTVEEAEIAARELVERARIAQERILTEARIAKDEDNQRREIDRTRTVEQADIAAREATAKARIAQELAVNAERIASEKNVRNLEIERNKSLEEAEIAAREAVEAARIAQDKNIAAARIASEEATRAREIERGKAIESAEIMARQAVESARIAQDGKVATERIARDEAVRQLEIERSRVIDAAEIKAREMVEAARIAQEKAVLAARIASEQETKTLAIAQTEALDAAEIRKRDAVERARIAAELELEKARIASQQSREVLEIGQKKAVEIAEEQRFIELAGTRVERTEADRRVKQADVIARQEVEKTEVGREQALETARLARRRALEQIEVARAQALQEAEIAAREEIERARIASERGLDEARIGRDLALRRLEVARERDVETALMDKAIALFQKSLEESAAKVEAEALRARAAEAEERVTTARDSEAARRRTSIEVMLAQKDAEEKRIAAQAEQVRAAVAAEAQKLLYEAENVLTDGARYGLFRRRLLDRIEGIVRESVKPMEKIEGIRILQVDGLSGGGGGRSDGRSPTDEVIELGAALPRAGSHDRPGAEGDRHRGRQPVEAWRADARGKRHAAGRQGGGRRRAEGTGAVAGRLGSAPRGRRQGSRIVAKHDGQGLHLQRRQRPRGQGLGARARLQWAARLASGHRREPHRERRAGRQGRLHPRLPPAQWRPHPRAAAGPVGLRHVLHLLDPGIAHGRGELRRHAQAHPDHRRCAHVPGMDCRVRLRARA